ncbi:MAG: hypothetical protein ACRDHO_05005 [Actinomycetota bacterium]
MDRDHWHDPSAWDSSILDRMFVRYFLELPRPFDEVERALLFRPPDWVPGLAMAAEAHGRRLLTEVGFGPEGRRLEKQVEIEVGEPIRFPTKTVLPMTWRPTNAEALFPFFESDIEVGALGPGCTQLSVSARYRPPLGALGRMIDRVLMHRVAEATVKDFLDRAGEALLEVVSMGKSA